MMATDRPRNASEKRSREGKTETRDRDRESSIREGQRLFPPYDKAIARVEALHGLRAVAGQTAGQPLDSDMSLETSNHTRRSFAR